MNTQTATATAAQLSHRRRQYGTSWFDSADESSGYYDLCAVEDEEENENERWWEEDSCAIEDDDEDEYDMVQDFVPEERKQQNLAVPSIVLTTTEGNVFFGNAVPEGTWCTESRESLDLRIKHINNAETFLCPDDWRQLRNAHRLWQQQEYDQQMEQKWQLEQERQQEEKAEAALREHQQLYAPLLFLTTSDGDILTGDGIPEGQRAHTSCEARRREQQYAANAETQLCPGNWKKIRDANRPEEPEEEDPVLHVNLREAEAALALPKGSRSWQKRLARVNQRSQRRRARQQKLEEAERLWRLQKVRVEEFVAERKAKVEALERIGAAGGFPAWSRKMDREQGEAEERLRVLRRELEMIFEGDCGEKGEVEE
ncbi:hypothetical protein CNYM01_08677 [Colletotrichum nymphaeae SA-01]|uniref:Uncharacterized protein n=1 Tax=Colletotrichum nymphaeae SA-01 TaxID=1460502 RepID=A0A135T0X2_9PEZI|nr:hypothetical protein CNYM01_08677 [Colletotrichum nymphaeae SA-01]